MSKIRIIQSGFWFQWSCIIVVVKVEDAPEKLAFKLSFEFDLVREVIGEVLEQLFVALGVDLGDVGHHTRSVVVGQCEPQRYCFSRKEKIVIEYEGLI